MLGGAGNADGESRQPANKRGPAAVSSEQELRDRIAALEISNQASTERAAAAEAEAAAARAEAAADKAARTHWESKVNKQPVHFGPVAGPQMAAKIIEEDSKKSELKAPGGFGVLPLQSMGAATSYMLQILTISMAMLLRKPCCPPNDEAVDEACAENKKDLEDGTVTHADRNPLSSFKFWTSPIMSITNWRDKSMLAGKAQKDEIGPDAGHVPGLNFPTSSIFMKEER